MLINAIIFLGKKLIAWIQVKQGSKPLETHVLPMYTIGRVYKGQYMYLTKLLVAMKCIHRDNTFDQLSFLILFIGYHTKFTTIDSFHFILCWQSWGKVADAKRPIPKYHENRAKLC